MTLFGDGSDGGDRLYEDLPPDPVSESQARASHHGRLFDQEAFEFLEKLGARVLATKIRVDGYPLDAEVQGANGSRFFVDAHGTPDRTDRPQAGMRRTDTLLKFGFKALRLRDRRCSSPLLLITSHMPKEESAAAFLLFELKDAVFDAVATVGDFAGARRLHSYFNDQPAPSEPIQAAWRLQTVQLTLDEDPFAEDENDHA